MSRVVLSIVPNLALGIAGLVAGAFDRWGFLFGLAAGAVITYAFGFGGFMLVLSFVILGTAATRIRYRVKLDRMINEPRGGRRTWTKALGNLLVPASAAALAIVRPASLLGLFAVASLATAACDTVASEVGKAFATRCLTLPALKLQPAGAPGGISIVGTGWGVVAALAVGLVAVGFDLVGLTMLGYIVLAAVMATIVEGMLRSSLGLRSTQVANLINTLLGGLIAVAMAHRIQGS
jgi:uncharacterized protein (TIGR00297 family)